MVGAYYNNRTQAWFSSKSIFSKSFRNLLSKSASDEKSTNVCVSASSEPSDTWEHILE